VNDGKMSAGAPEERQAAHSGETRGRMSSVASVVAEYRCPVWLTEWAGWRGGWVLLVAFLVFLQFGWPRFGVHAAQLSGPQQEVDAWIDRVPLLTIGNRADDALHEVLGAAFVGRSLVIAERRAGTLRYFDRTSGRLERVVGGRGDGPGEYQMLVFFKGQGTMVYTFDLATARLTVLDSVGEVVETVSIRPWESYSFSEVIDVFSDGSLLVSSVGVARGAVTSPVVHRDTLALARYDRMGNYANDLGTYLGSEFHLEPFGRGGGSTARWSGPFRREAYIGAVDNGYYIADNMEPSIPVFDQSGGLVYRMGAEGSAGRRLSASDRRGFSDLAKIDGWRAPEYYPRYSRVATLGGSVWSRNYKEDGNAVYSWTVYLQGGSVIERVGSREMLWILAVDGDTAAVLVTDALDVQTVELRRIVRPPGG